MRCLRLAEHRKNILQRRIRGSDGGSFASNRRTGGMRGQIFTTVPSIDHSIVIIFVSVKESDD